MPLFVIFLKLKYEFNFCYFAHFFANTKHSKWAMLATATDYLKSEHLYALICILLFLSSNTTSNEDIFGVSFLT